jgi:hypothetical protein
MEKREIIIANAFDIHGLTFIPVIESTLRYWYYNNTLSYYYSGNPVIILVVAKQTVKAFHISGKELPLEELCSLVPDIAGIVSARPTDSQQIA